MPDFKGERLVVTEERRARYHAMREAGEVETIKQELKGTKQDIMGIATLLREDRILGPAYAPLITEEHNLRAEFLEAHARTRFDLMEWLSRTVEGKFTDGGKKEERKKQVNEVMRKLHTLLFNRMQWLQTTLVEGQVATLLSSPLDNPLQGKGEYIDLYIRGLINDFMELAQLAEIPPFAESVVHEFLQDSTIQIEEKLQLDETTIFFTTPTITPQGHTEVLMFVVYEGRLLPRVAYKSQSGTAWRINMDPGRSDGAYDKGPGYTQSNKPMVEVEQVLYHLESRYRKRGIQQRPKRDFKSGAEMFTAYNELEWRQTPPAGLEEVAAQGAPFCWGFGGGRLNESLFNSIPERFIPDFSEGPIKIANRQGTMSDQGQVRLELYKNKYLGKNYYFWMAYDEQGRVWVERGYEGGASVMSSYGTTKVIWEWALFSKPFEHKTQRGQLRTVYGLEANNLQRPDGGFGGENIAIAMEGEPTYSGYVDVSPTLDKFNFIQRFREQRGIRRQAVIPGTGSMAKARRTNTAREMLSSDHIVITPELNGLVSALESSRGGSISEQVIQILKNPGASPAITLRGLRRIIYECHARFSEQETQKVLNTILDLFKHGFPIEKTVYTAIYEDLLGMFGSMGTAQGEGRQRQRRLGDPMYSVMEHDPVTIPAAVGQGPVVGAYLPAPKIVYYTTRLRILKEACRVDTQSSDSGSLTKIKKCVK